MRYRSINQVLFALFLLTLGVVLLLVNLGVISLGIKEFFVISYPFVLLAVGILMLLNQIITKRKNKLFISFFLVLLSSLLVLDRLEILDFRFIDVWKLWPALIIYVAFSILFKKDGMKIKFTNDLSSDINEKVLTKTSHQETRKVKGLSIGDVSFNESNWALEPMELYNSIGDYYIDFCKAYIPEKETPITVRGWIGDVKMIVPEDIPVCVHSKINVGDIRIFEQKSDSINRNVQYKSPGYDEATRKLKITVELKIGSIRIDKV